VTATRLARRAVILADAGIHAQALHCERSWIPASAGMTTTRTEPVFGQTPLVASGERQRVRPETLNSTLAQLFSLGEI